MIRINLLPQQRRERARAEPAGGGQLWLVVLLVLFLGEVVGLFVFHGLKGQELEEQLRKNRELQAQIDRSRESVKNHKDVKAKLDKLKAREDAIEKLQTARTGPTAMLLEVARMLSQGKGPSVDPEKLDQMKRENPLAVYNPNWDTRGLWLTRFVEQQRMVRLEGLARDGEDVSELARRMDLSNYFYEVKLLPAKKETDPVTKTEVVKFQLEAKVRY